MNPLKLLVVVLYPLLLANVLAWALIAGSILMAAAWACVGALCLKFADLG